MEIVELSCPAPPHEKNAEILASADDPALAWRDEPGMEFDGLLGWSVDDWSTLMAVSRTPREWGARSEAAALESAWTNGVRRWAEHLERERRIEGK